MAGGKNGPPVPIGRPSTYDAKIADSILEMYKEGASLRGCCEAHHIAPSTFLLWVKSDYDGLSERYAQAREICEEIRREDVLFVADDPRNTDEDFARRSRLMMDARKWAYGQMFKNQPNKTEAKQEDDGGVVNDLPDPPGETT